MPTASDITKALAGATGAERAFSWDPVGLQLGDPESEVNRVAVCHEVTDEVCASLEGSDVGLLVTYHPLMFTPTNRVLSSGSIGSRVFSLIRMGIGLVVTHTDFDAMNGGSGDALATALRLKEVEPFGGDGALEPSIGRHGLFHGTLAALDARVSDLFGSAGLRITGDRARDLTRVAVVPGSGGDFIERASVVADALVTGDVSHHRSVQARDLGLAVVDPGHTATERPGMAVLVALVRRVSGLDTLDLTGADPKTWS